MPIADVGRFTVGVFQDLEWAARGVAALQRHGFVPGSLSVIGKESPDVAAFMRQMFGADPQRFELKGIGPTLVHGPLLAALQGSDRGLETLGLAVSMKRVGFQAHDGQIFDTLTARGGVLVAVHNEPRAADALATLHSYGGGNAAIGAWTGRL